MLTAMDFHWAVAKPWVARRADPEAGVTPAAAGFAAPANCPPRRATGPKRAGRSRCARHLAGAKQDGGPCARTRPRGGGCCLGAAAGASAATRRPARLRPTTATATATAAGGGPRGAWPASATRGRGAGRRRSACAAPPPSARRSATAPAPRPSTTGHQDGWGWDCDSSAVASGCQIDAPDLERQGCACLRSAPLRLPSLL